MQPEGTGREYPHPGSAFALARPSRHRAGFEIVAGARRFRAAQIAESAPSRPHRQPHGCGGVGGAAHREPAKARRSPIRGGAGFPCASQLGGAEVQRRADRSQGQANLPAYVAQRVRLTELVASVVEAFYAEEIGVGHALLLAKLQPDQQEKALSECFREEWAGRGKGQAHPPTRSASPALD